MKAFVEGVNRDKGSMDQQFSVEIEKFCS